MPVRARPAARRAVASPRALSPQRSDGRGEPDERRLDAEHVADPLVGEDLARRPVGDHPAALDEHEPREEVRGEAEVVEHGDDRGPVALVEVDEQLHRLDLVAEVEVDRRLVEEQHRRVLRDGEREQHELPLAERQLPGVAAQEVPEADPLDRGRDGRPVGRPRPAERVPRAAAGRAPRPPRPASRTAATSAGARRRAGARPRTAPATRSACRPAAPGRRSGGACRRAPGGASTCRRRSARRARPARPPRAPAIRRAGSPGRGPRP